MTLRRLVLSTLRNTGRGLRLLCTVAGAVVLLGSGTTAFLTQRTLSQGPDLPDAPGTVALRLDLTTPPADGPAGPAIFAALAGEAARPTLTQIVQALDAAAADPRVGRLHARIGPACCGSLATAQELHHAILRFRDSGKETRIHADSLGEGGSGTSAVLVASAFAHISLAPHAHAAPTGVRIEIPFYGEALSRLGAAAQFARRGDFKSAPESFTFSKPTGPARENMKSLVDDLFSVLVQNIANARGLTPTAVESLIHRSPLTAAEARSTGLVDAIQAEPSEHWRSLPNAVSLTDYLRATDDGRDVPGRARSGDSAKVALLHATGPILEPDAQARPGHIEPRRLANTLAQLIDDAHTHAILLRVDSPGGSVAGSALVGAEIERARSLGKPIIIWMGAAAASGGYWIATHAAGIVAQPTTLTGSIGVYAGKVTFGNLAERFGVHFAAAQRGDRAGVTSLFTPFSVDDLTRLSASLDATYAAFVGRVAEGRGLPLERAQAVAQGRVWTGRQALYAGLLDRLGGLHDALALTRERLALSPDAPLHLVEAGSDSRDVVAALRRLAGVPELPLLTGASTPEARLTALVEAAGIALPTGALSMPPLLLR